MCGEPVPLDELWQQTVEGGTVFARGHRPCIEDEWGPVPGSEYVAPTTHSGLLLDRDKRQGFRVGKLGYGAAKSPYAAGDQSPNATSWRDGWVLGNAIHHQAVTVEPNVLPEGDNNEPELRSVTLAEIDDQRAKGWPDFHPEDYCHRCGGRNVPSWTVDSDRFNVALAHPNEHLYNGIVCPGCFVVLHEKVTGMRTDWRLVPGSPFRWIDQ